MNQEMLSEKSDVTRNTCNSCRDGGTAIADSYLCEDTNPARETMVPDASTNHSHWLFGAVSLEHM